MKIIVVDDEKLALESTRRCITQVDPECTVETFHYRREQDKDAILNYTVVNKPDVAFMDIELKRGDSGMDLARELQGLHPTINIIFMTAYSEYTIPAFRLRASGYILKPPTVERVEEELKNLRHMVEHAREDRVFTGAYSINKEGLWAVTFGSFNIYYKDTLIRFHRTKAKEILAYLIDRRGGTISTADVVAAVFEDVDYNRSMQKQIQVYIKDMQDALESVGMEDFIIRTRGALSINASRLSCDYYDFLNKDKAAIDAYAGEYMSNYSWGEETNGWLNSQKEKYSISSG